MCWSRHVLLVAVSVFFTAAAMAQETATSEKAKTSDTPEARELASGDVAPDFKLKTIGEKPVVLSERFGTGGKPVVLIFSRANW